MCTNASPGGDVKFYVNFCLFCPKHAERRSPTVATCCDRITQPALSIWARWSAEILHKTLFVCQLLFAFVAEQRKKKFSNTRSAMWSIKIHNLCRNKEKRWRHAQLFPKKSSRRGKHSHSHLKDFDPVRANWKLHWSVNLLSIVGEEKQLKSHLRCDSLPYDALKIYCS